MNVYFNVQMATTMTQCQECAHSVTKTVLLAKSHLKCAQAAEKACTCMTHSALNSVHSAIKKTISQSNALLATLLAIGAI